MKKYSIPSIRVILFVVLFFSGFQNKVFAQEKNLKASFIGSNPPTIDGQLNDEAWLNASEATNFVTISPNPGNPSQLPSSVKIVYDNFAVYVGARLTEVSKDSIIRQLSNRDEFENTDLFGVYFDTYNDDINAFGFEVTAAGVQLDVRMSAGNDDYSWNAVWESKVSLSDDGWIVEMRIPFSAIRFPEQSVQSWGINFFRQIRRTREESYWSEIKPDKNGLVNQFGLLHGVENVEPPLRLQFTPYVAFYDKIETQNGSSNNSYSIKGGLDLKYGLSEAYTLDMTLIPDFGQVQSDNQVLNLSPFEVQFQERRPFFTEGTELFNKGDFLYTRRIGKTPDGYWDLQNKLGDDEKIVSNPSETQLLNASKISGRNQNGLGIGILNAVTKAQTATIESADGTSRTVETEPLTNYNVLVFDQNLKNNSYVTLVNTNVWRAGSAYDANLTGTQFFARDKANTYGVFGRGAITQQHFADSTQLGHMYNIRLQKQSGNWQGGLQHYVESHTYDPNDLGYLSANNSFNFGLDVSYTMFKPKGAFNRMKHSFWANYNMLYFPRTFSDVNVGYELFFMTKKFFASGIWFESSITEKYDYFEPRTFGRYYIFPTSHAAGFWTSTDYRKKLSFDSNCSFAVFNEKGRSTFSFKLSPRYRVSDHLMIIYEYNQTFKLNDVGFVNNVNDSIYLGVRDLTISEQILNANYIFTNRMGLSFRLRHYWSLANYNDYRYLAEDGKLLPAAYTGLDGNNESMHNVNFNAFNIDMVFRWVFSPGSELNITYKRAILNSNNEIVRNYADNWVALNQSPLANSINIKLLYFIDAYSLLKKEYRIRN